MSRVVIRRRNQGESLDQIRSELERILREEISAEMTKDFEEMTKQMRAELESLRYTRDSNAYMLGTYQNKINELESRLTRSQNFISALTDAFHNLVYKVIDPASVLHNNALYHSLYSWVSGIIDSMPADARHAHYGYPDSNFFTSIHDKLRNIRGSFNDAPTTNAQEEKIDPVDLSVHTLEYAKTWIMPMGKYEFRTLERIPDHYLKWGARTLDINKYGHIRKAFAAEIKRRGIA